MSTEHATEEVYMLTPSAAAEIARGKGLNGIAAVIERAASERDDLLAMTEMLDEHPEGYAGPCLCKLCKSYA